MQLDVRRISENWINDKPQYSELGEKVYSYISKSITEYGILPEISWRTKSILSIVKKIKKRQKENENYDYSCLTDKLGIRFISSFKEDLVRIESFIREKFEVHKSENKGENLDFDKLGYISNHYDVTIKAELEEFRELSKLKDLKFEIQVRTLNQHAWSNTAHTLLYKQEAEIPTTLKRKIYRLLSLYEIADDEISSVNNQLIQHPDNYTYSVLKLLEGKIYKFAGVDFDRETSLSVLKTLMGYFDTGELDIIKSELPLFLEKNIEKFERIFYENRNRLFEISFVSQPEIFLVWYILEKFPFTIEENWENDFDPEELESIKTIWGEKL